MTTPEPRPQWGIVSPRGYIAFTNATRTDAITDATDFWEGHGATRKARWRKLRREGWYATPVVTLSAEALRHAKDMAERIATMHEEDSEGMVEPDTVRYAMEAREAFLALVTPEASGDSGVGTQGR